MILCSTSPSATARESVPIDASGVVTQSRNERLMKSPVRTTTTRATTRVTMRAIVAEERPCWAADLFAARAAPRSAKRVRSASKRRLLFSRSPCEVRIVLLWARVAAMAGTAKVFSQRAAAA